MHELLKNKALGCLTAGAAGDALGYAVEFMSYGMIMKRYGPGGIRTYDLNPSGIAEISDDTQMTLFTAEGIMRGDITSAYLDWLHTQTQPSPESSTEGRLAADPRLYSRRAPGLTCIGALRSIDRGEPVDNDSRGCGGIMRVAPIAIYGAAHNIDIMQSTATACNAARVTHRNPLGWLPAGMLVYVISKILNCEIDVDCAMLSAWAMDALTACESMTDGDGISMASHYPKACEELRRGTSKAIRLATHPDRHPDDEECIRSLGEGWTGEEAWYIALYCAIRHVRSLEAGLIAAVNHSGDSDSTGATAGNILGAIHGYSAIPSSFSAPLELLDLIQTMADQLTR